MFVIFIHVSHSFCLKTVSWFYDIDTALFIQKHKYLNVICLFDLFYYKETNSAP